MQRRCISRAVRSVRIVAISLASVLALAASANAALFGTWTPAGDSGDPDSAWVAYTLGLSTDDGTNIAAIDVKLRGTLHQRWTSLVDGDPFEATPSSTARNFDSHLTPIASALIVNLNEDINLNASDPATPLLASTVRRQSGIGTTLSGVWGIPGADQTPSLDFAYIVVPRNADLSQFQFDIDASTHLDGAYNTYGLHGCSLFSAGCSFNLTSTFSTVAPTPPPAPSPPPAPPVVVLPVEPPVVFDPPTPPVNPPVDPVVDPQSPVIREPPIILAEDPWPPRNPDPNETVIPNNELVFTDPPYEYLVDPWLIRTGYYGSHWPNYGTIGLIDWYRSDYVVDYDTPSYLTDDLTYIDFDGGGLLLAAPVAFKYGTAVAGLIGATAQPGFFTNASSIAGSMALLDSGPTAPEPTAAILFAIGFAGLAALTRRR